MAKIETLTAYKCKFSYLQRNNPLLEKQREAIKEGKDPEYSFSDFIDVYQTYTKNLAIGENTDRAIILDEDNYYLPLTINVTERPKDNIKLTWYQFLYILIKLIIEKLISFFTW